MLREEIKMNIETTKITNKMAKNFKSFAFKYGIVLVLLLISFVTAFINPVFLTANNLLNVLRQACVAALLSLALGTLIISGNIDLSVGSVLCLAGIIAYQQAWRQNLSLLAYLLLSRWVCCAVLSRGFW
jgi:ABC-type xylose transport system permease subunit